jgi:hypothetical protein
MSLLIGISLNYKNCAYCRALDSLKEGKRMVEAKYAIIRHEVVI